MIQFRSSGRGRGAAPPPRTARRSARPRGGRASGRVGDRGGGVGRGRHRGRRSRWRVAARGRPGRVCGFPRNPCEPAPVPDSRSLGARAVRRSGTSPRRARTSPPRDPRARADRSLRRRTPQPVEVEPDPFAEAIVIDETGQSRAPPRRLTPSAVVSSRPCRRSSSSRSRSPRRCALVRPAAVRPAASRPEEPDEPVFGEPEPVEPPVGCDRHRRWRTVEEEFFFDAPAAPAARRGAATIRSSSRSRPSPRRCTRGAARGRVVRRWTTGARRREPLALSTEAASRRVPRRPRRPSRRPPRRVGPAAASAAPEHCSP